MYKRQAGITMDERIRNLMRERGQEDLLMNVDDPELEGKLLAALETLSSDCLLYTSWSWCVPII